jgi:hypothetical protein
MKPYNDIELNRNTLLREFNARIDDIEYTWHRDEDDRIIEVFSGAGWQLQLDNQLPVLLESGCEYHIPAGMWHRLHKGQDNLTILISEGKKKDNKRGFRSVKYGADNNPKVTKMDFLPTKTLKSIAKEKEVDEDVDALEERKKRRKKRKSKPKLTQGYKANRTQKSQDKLQKLIQRFNKAKKTPGKKDDLAAIKARDRFEKTQYKSSRKSQYNEANDIDTLINELAEEMDIFEKKKRKKRKKKKKGGSRKISSKVDKSLKKKAKDRNAPVGALKAIYRKGMGAFYSSGSRSGQNPHSWAMARVNSVLSGGKARSVDAAQWKQIQKHRKKKRK